MKKLALALIAGTIAMLPMVASAATPWQRNHPARTYDNARLRNQNRRITQGARNGTLTHAQAHQLRSDDHAIHQEERDMARQNPGGHLTGTEQRALNQQLNQNSSSIYNEKH